MNWIELKFLNSIQFIQIQLKIKGMQIGVEVIESLLVASIIHIISLKFWNPRDLGFLNKMDLGTTWKVDFSTKFCITFSK